MGLCNLTVQEESKLQARFDAGTLLATPWFLCHLTTITSFILRHVFGPWLTHLITP